jgi:hypothetical protein
VDDRREERGAEGVTEAGTQRDASTQLWRSISEVAEPARVVGPPVGDDDRYGESNFFQKKYILIARFGTVAAHVTA